MQTITFNELEKDLRNVLNLVKREHQPLAVSIDNDNEIVVMEAEEYSSLMETCYLSNNPVNVARLKKGINQHKQGKTKTIEIKTYLD